MNVVHKSLPQTASLRVARKRELRSEAIVDAAMALVAAEGLDALTLGRVAEVLGYVPAALYRYFSAKDALLAALQRRAIAEVDAALCAGEAELIRRAQKRTPEIVCFAALLTASRVYTALPVTHPQAYFLIAALLGDPRILLSTAESLRTAPLFTALLGRIHFRFEEAVALGALHRGDAAVRTMVLWGTLHGSLLLEKARRVVPTLPAAAAVWAPATQALLRGWGAKPALVTRAYQLALKASLA